MESLDEKLRRFELPPGLYEVKLLVRNDGDTPVEVRYAFEGPNKGVVEVSGPLAIQHMGAYRKD